MFGTIRGLRLVRPTTLLLTGAALTAVLIGPVSGRGSGSAPAATTYTRTASCAGLNFYPAESSDGQGTAGVLRIRESNVPGDGAYLCDPGLPNGAVVTKVQFTLRDVHADFNITDCALVRSGLTTATADSYQVLAGPLVTSGFPDVVRLTDSNIHFATINNASFGYWLQCRIGTSHPGLGIYGASVTYKVSAANG